MLKCLFKGHRMDFSPAIRRKSCKLSDSEFYESTMFPLCLNELQTYTAHCNSCIPAQLSRDACHFPLHKLSPARSAAIPADSPPPPFPSPLICHFIYQIEVSASESFFLLFSFFFFYFFFNFIITVAYRQRPC